MRSARVAFATLLALAAAACSDTPSPSAPSVVTPPSAPSRALVGGTGGTSMIASTFATGKCIDVRNVSRDDGARLQMWTCAGGPNQQWTWMSDGTIRVYDGTKCIDAYGSTGNNGDPVVIWSCNGGANQRWTATAAGEIRGINGKCIDITGISTALMAPLQLWECAGGPNQKWDNSGGGGAAAAPAPQPPPPPAPELTGLPIYPGQSIQAAVNANPTGTQFLIKAGTHTRQTVVPKTGDVFQGEPGAVLDGQGATTFAFKGHNGSSWVNGVTIRGLKITGYAPAYQNGAIAAGNGPGDATSGWVVDGNEISYNGQYGIRIGDNMRVINNNVHHNAVMNISGAGNNTVIEGNEIAFGTYNGGGDANFEAGGTKFVMTDGLVLRNNYVHDNRGVGLWTDEGNINVLIEGNRVENNASEGIAHEISYRAVIRNNIVRNNGWSDPRGRRWLWNAGIGIHASPDVEVYGNTVSGNMNGIVGIQQNRGSGRFGPYLVQNLYVHDNTVTQTTLPPPYEASAAAGLITDTGDPNVFTARNNRFVNNTYYLGQNAYPFEWAGSWRNEYQWRSVGQDVTGAFYR